MNRISLILLLSLAFGGQASVQAISLEEILNRTRQALEAELDRNAGITIEHTERFISGKLNDQGVFEKVDTVIARVTKQGETELAREVIYSTTDDSKNRQGKRSLWEMLDDMTVDSPYYIYELLEITEDDFIVGISPRKQRPDKGQIDGKYYIDKHSFLLRSMDFIVPRPEKLKELTMRFDFTKLGNGLYVTESMSMLGRVRVLFGIVDIRFSVNGDFYDYKLIESIEKRNP